MDCCKLCGAKLDSPKENAVKLCRGCELAVTIDVLETARIMRKCEHVVATSTRIQTRLYHCLLLSQKAKWLLRYEKKGISTITPLPSEWILRYNKLYDDIVMDRIFSEVDDAMARAELSTTPGALDFHVSTVLQKINDGRKLFLDKTRYATLNTRVMSYLYNNMLTLTV